MPSRHEIGLWPREAEGTEAADFTDCASMTPAVGSRVVGVCRLYKSSRDAAVLDSVRSRSRPTSSADRVLYRATDAILISS